MIEYNYLFSFIAITLLGIIIYLFNELRIKDNTIAETNELIGSYKEKLIQLKNENSLLQQKSMFVEKQSDKMIEQFKSLSHETVASQSFSFIKVIEDHIHKIKTTNQEESSKNKSTIKEILSPIEHTISNFEKIINSFENKTSIDNREIFSKLSQVINTSFNLQQEVNKVIHSLRSPNVKGIWGEMQLKRLVQLCGMEEHCDFQWQSTIEKGLKPDMVINLPNGKQIIVDSKVSLSAYINCMDTNDEEKKKYYLQDHARQIKQHITSLHSKKYWENMENCANFVILFLPGECFLSSALEVNPAMLEYAAKYNIILATPTTMIGLLKTIAFGWENIHISKDIEKIKFILQNLYSELSTVLDDMGAMGKIIESLNNVYKTTYHTIDCNLKYTLEEIHHKYSITFNNNIKEEKLKKTKVPDSIKQELKNKNQTNTIQDNILNNTESLAQENIWKENIAQENISVDEIKNQENIPLEPLNPTIIHDNNIPLDSHIHMETFDDVDHNSHHDTTIINHNIINPIPSHENINIENLLDSIDQILENNITIIANNEDKDNFKNDNKYMDFMDDPAMIIIDNPQDNGTSKPLKDSKDKNIISTSFDDNNYYNNNFLLVK